MTVSYFLSQFYLEHPQMRDLLIQCYCYCVDSILYLSSPKHSYKLFTSALPLVIARPQVTDSARLSLQCCYFSRLVLSVHLHRGLCWLESMGAEHRLFKQVLPRPQIPERLKWPTWMFYFIKGDLCMLHTTHGGKETISNAGCVMGCTRLLSRVHDWKKTAAAVEGTSAWLPNGHLIFCSSPCTLLFTKVFLLAGHTHWDAWWKPPCWKTNIWLVAAVKTNKETKWNNFAKEVSV